MTSKSSNVPSLCWINNNTLLNFGIIMWSYDIKECHCAITVLGNVITMLNYHIMILHYATTKIHYIWPSQQYRMTSQRFILSPQCRNVLSQCFFSAITTLHNQTIYFAITILNLDINMFHVPLYCQIMMSQYSIVMKHCYILPSQ